MYKSITIGQLLDDMIYYYDQNPSGFSFLVQITAFVIYISLGLPRFKYDKKNDKDSGHDSWRHRANGLLKARKRWVFFQGPKFFF